MLAVAYALPALAQAVVTPSCPQGYVLSGSQCIQSTPQPGCPEGYVFAEGQCLPASAPQRPAESRPANLPDQTAPTAYEMTIIIQQELTRLGCNPGQVDGDWGARTRDALSEFNRLTGLSLDVSAPSQETMNLLATTGNAVCANQAPRPAPAPPTVKVNTPPVKKTSPPKKAPPTVKKAKPKKKKEYFGGEDSKVKCESGIITQECFR